MVIPNKMEQNVIFKEIGKPMEPVIISSSALTGSPHSGSCCKLSRYIPNGLRDIIKNVPEDSWILGVRHNYNGRTDLQIGISGHPNTEENLSDGLFREMREELSLSPRGKIDRYEVGGLIEGKNKDIYYCIPISDCEITRSDVHAEKHDNCRIHIIIIVHGTKKDMLRFMSNEKINPKNTDGINAIWACKKSYVMDIINLVTMDGTCLFYENKTNYFLSGIPS